MRILIVNTSENTGGAAVAANRLMVALNNNGVKIDFPDKWVHLRKSNTEPIIRVYSEAQTMPEADDLGKKLMQVVYDMQ